MQITRRYAELIGENLGTKVIVIEDGLSTTTQLKSTPEFKQFDIKTFTKSQHEIGSLQKHNPDLVILDSNPSLTTSLKICSEIRTVSSVPIMVLSVTNHPELVEKTLDAGADKFLQKPVPAKILAAHVNTLTRRAQAEKKAALNLQNKFIQ